MKPVLLKHVNSDSLEELLQVKPRDWKFLVLHHSGVFPNQNPSVFETDSYHRRPKSEGGRGWRYGLGYHLYIELNGDVYASERWMTQRSGAHGNHYYNFWGLGVCIVGDYRKIVPTDWVADSFKNSIVALALYLQKPWDLRRYLLHREVKETTECPGVGRDWLIHQIKDTGLLKDPII